MTTPAQLLSDTYAYFSQHGYWPLLRTLQARYGPKVIVRALAAELGRGTLICHEGADARCMISLDGLASLPAAMEDLDRMARAVSYIARQFESSGSKPIDQDAIGQALHLTDLQRRRVGGLLALTSRLWTGGGWSEDNATFSVNPSEESYFFRDVTSFAEFEEARAQLLRGDRSIAEALSNEYRRSQRQPDTVVEELPTRYRLSDNVLDAMLQRDLIELSNTQSLGAWKATAVLAGACLETLLFDVCKQREAECIDYWGGKWPREIGATELAKFAVRQQWIQQDHAQLAAVLRRWRNVVHPYAATLVQEPTKELADALVAVLRLLIADLSQREAI